MNTLRIPTNYIHLENRDQQLLQIENLIAAKRKMLIDKQKKFKNITKENTFLNEVKQDYSKYYGYIVKQKEEQMSALTMLNTYIKDLTISNSLSKNNIQDAKNEQEKILTEINSIKKGLDDIITGMNDGI
jgi:DNA repair exonuclease SbcCD ATPase subunit